jgi:hypothetical protein
MVTLALAVAGFPAGLAVAHAALAGLVVDLPRQYENRVHSIVG